MKKNIFLSICATILISGLVGFAPAGQDIEVNDAAYCGCFGVDKYSGSSRIDSWYETNCGKDEWDAKRKRQAELDKIYNGTGMSAKVFPVADMWCR